MVSFAWSGTVGELRQLIKQGLDFMGLNKVVPSREADNECPCCDNLDIGCACFKSDETKLK